MPGANGARGPSVIQQEPRPRARRDDPYGMDLGDEEILDMFRGAEAIAKHTMIYGWDEDFADRIADHVNAKHRKWTPPPPSPSPPPQPATRFPGQYFPLDLFLPYSVLTLGLTRIGFIAHIPQSHDNAYRQPAHFSQQVPSIPPVQSFSRNQSTGT